MVSWPGVGATVLMCAMFGGSALAASKDIQGLANTVEREEQADHNQHLGVSPTAHAGGESNKPCR